MFSTGKPAMESLKILKAGWFRKKHKVETVRGRETVRLRLTEEPQRIKAATGKNQRRSWKDDKEAQEN